MGKQDKSGNNSNELFISSQMMMVISYTIFSIILVCEIFVMDWEKWAVILITGGIAISWYMHIMRRGTDSMRLWIVAFLMMATFFYYGSHITSTYDLAIVMSAVIILYIMTAMHSLITLCQYTYYITMIYAIIQLARSGEVFDPLLVTRTFLHFAMVTMICWLARVIIDKWKEVLGHSEEEIKQLTIAAERLGDFLANISHEIRTPINAILGLCDMTMEEETDIAKRSNLASIEEAGKKIGEQISDILDYSEIDRSDLTNNYEDYMLSSVLNDLVNELAPYRKTNIELIIDVDASIPSVMNTDVAKLKKILWHLIMNGIKFTNEGGVYVHLSAVPQEYGINLCIEIKDTGIGMDAAQLEQIFDNFYKADSGRARRTGGLGLGMPIVLGFVRSLGGFMTVDSTPEQGTCVRVSIPSRVIDDECCMSVADRENISLGAYLHFDKYPDPHVREYYDSMVKNLVTGLKVSMHRVENKESLHALNDSKRLTHLFAGPEEYLSARDYIEELAKNIIVTVVANPGEIDLPKGSRVRLMPKPFYCFPVVTILNSTVDDDITDEGKLTFPGVRALIVDDEPMNLIVSLGMFKGYGMVVTTCESGMESIELCRANEYDIIFMDHMMPGMDGVEAMKRIRSDLARNKKSVPIIAFTANAVSSAKEMFRQEGFDGFVSKPVDRVELERVLKHVLPASYQVIDAEPEDNEAKTGPAYDAGKAEHEKESETNDVISRLVSYGVDVNKGLYYSQNDREFYISLLAQYAKESPVKKNLMKKSLDENDLAAYAIQVHSIKSTSKMIGAMQLSEAARELEEAGKKNDREYIDANHEAMLVMYDRILSILPAAVDESVADEVSASSDDDILEFGPMGEEGGEA